MKKNFLLQGSAIETWSNISLSCRETEMCFFILYSDDSGIKCAVKHLYADRKASFTGLTPPPPRNKMTQITRGKTTQRQTHTEFLQPLVQIAACWPVLTLHLPLHFFLLPTLHPHTDSPRSLLLAYSRPMSLDLAADFILISSHIHVFVFQP